MQRIVINKCFGGFGLSDEAFEHYLNLKGIKYGASASAFPSLQNSKDYWKDGNFGVSSDYLSDRDIDRNDPALIQTIEELGEKADGQFTNLKIVEVPDDVEWLIEEYDGNEWVAEKHRTWG